MAMVLAAVVATVVGLPDTAIASEVAPLRGVGKPGAIENHYIVVLDRRASGAALAHVKDTARGHGGSLRLQYTHALDGFAARLSDRALRAIRRDPAVAYVEQDRVVSLNSTQISAPWNLDRIDQHALPLNSVYTYWAAAAANVTAYVIDTGIRTTHADFGQRARSGQDVVDGTLPADDCNGHGTHVAGTLGGATHGVAKAVNLVAVRVLDCNGTGTIAGVVSGVDYVTGDHATGQPAVANMSLSAGASPSIDEAVRRSIDDGVSYVVAAGNSAQSACNSSPARVEPALTVGSTNTTDTRSTFSNFGTCLDLFAPGENINSTWNSSDTATKVLDGTSMAAPHVAGAIALYLGQNPGASPAVAARAVTNNATVDVVANPGQGSPNRLLYTAPPGWRVIGVADFNHDGYTDLAWRRQDESGEVRLWLLDGAGHLLRDLGLPGPAAGWRVIGVADFDHDGYTDLAWRRQDESGEVRLWLLDGAGHLLRDLGLPRPDASG
jgi:subtilisin family serine protease